MMEKLDRAGLYARICEESDTRSAPGVGAGGGRRVCLTSDQPLDGAVGCSWT